MIGIPLAEVARALGLPHEGWTGEATGVCTHSGRVRLGDLFVALKGRHVDAARFVPEVLARGAVAAVTGPAGPDDARVLRVERPIEALGRIGVLVRDRFEGPVVGITGTAGKTSVKEFLRGLLPPRLRAVLPEASHNNAEGVPLTIARLEPDSGVLVVELGTNRPGEIAELCGIARPTLGVVTSIGPGHLEGLATVEGVLEEKLALAHALPEGARLVLNADDPVLRSAHLPPGTRPLRAGLEPGPGHVVPGPGSGPGRLVLDDGTVLEHGLRSRVHTLNLWIAVAVARELSVTSGELARATPALRPAPLRGERVERGGSTLILDCYNANPLSMAAALDELAASPAPRGVVLGEMLELGDETEHHHRELGRRLAALDPAWAVFVGPSGAVVEEAARAAGLPSGRLLVAADAAEARDAVKSRLAGTATVLLKASRAVGLERVLEEGGDA